MNYDEFIERLQVAYAKEYNKVQIQDIVDFLEEFNISEERCKYLYNVLVDSCKFLPKRTDIKAAFEQSRAGFTEKFHGGLHPQSPFNAVIKYQGKSTEWLIWQCEEIRKKHEEGKELTGAEISFITYWESLGSVPFEYRELMKNYIIKDDRQSIYDLIDAKGYGKNLEKNPELQKMG